MPTTSVSIITSAPEPVIPANHQPVRLIIPKIKVDAAIENVGLATDGTMAAPKNPQEVSWYAPGPRPGENGSAVIAGHYGWKNGSALVFNRLHTLRTGDTVSVKDADGTILTFVVRTLRHYDPKVASGEVFDSTDAMSHLNLITCEGVWNEVTKGYPTRLVVFTDIVK